MSTGLSMFLIARLYEAKLIGERLWQAPYSDGKVPLPHPEGQKSDKAAAANPPAFGDLGTRTTCLFRRQAASHTIC